MQGLAEEDLVERVSTLLMQRGLMMVSAESCTGGMIGAAMTDRAGSSNVYAGGFITYSNELKTRLLGVPEPMLERHGAVSANVADAMATGAVFQSGADIGVAVTGIAGPTGGSAEKPVGLVYIGWAVKGGPAHTAEHRFSGDRDSIRRQTVDAALSHLVTILETLT